MQTTQGIAVGLASRSAQDLMLVDGLDELIAQLEYRQALALLLDGPHIAVPERRSLAHCLGLPFRRLIACQAYAAQLLQGMRSLVGEVQSA